MLIIFIPFCFLSEKKSRIILRILISLIVLLSLVCIVFFANAGFLLDKVVFTYTFKEILGIIKSSGKSPVWVYIVVAVLPIAYFFVSGIRIKIKNIKINRILLMVFSVLILLSFFVFNKLPLEAEQYHIKTNKGYFFVKSIFKKHIITFKEDDEKIIKAVSKFRSYFPEHQFKEIEFPFLYQDSCHDVLSSFFDLKQEPPNFVFVIVESLGYDLYKNDYQLMPFLDSLSKHSLTWDNCLSVSARTYGVLPALFGASPLGEKGFLESCPNNPEHHTLPSILHNNNYTNYFFYGGWIGFDNMGAFAQKNNMTYLRKKEWDKDIEDQTIGVFWGYEDHLTYLQAQRKLNQKNAYPRMDVYMSLSTHDPFEYPNSSHFQDLVKNKVTKSKTLSEQQKNDIINSIDVYGGFAYSDWAMRQLIEDYKKRDDFDNTIFIITGDHNAFVRQLGGYQNYHVPLIIYSPMLKSPRNMKGIVSHRDITPTILSLLQNKYNITTPTEVTWLNTSLDTSLTFNANTFAPLQIIDHSIGGILYKNYMFCEGILEEFTNGALQKSNNNNVLQKMEQMLSLYKSLDLYVLQNNALIRNYYAHKSINVTKVNVEDTIARIY